MSRHVRLSVQLGDIRRVHADVVALKYQGALYGSTGRVAGALGIGEDEMRLKLPSVGSLLLVPGLGKIAARQAAFLRVVPMAAFTYDHIRQFSADVLRGLRERAPEARHLALTVHGVMVGMDFDRSCRAEFEGCVAAVGAAECPRSLERITVVHQKAESLQELQQVLQDVLPDGTIDLPSWCEPLTAAVPGQPAAAPSLFDVFISFKSEDGFYAGQVFDFLSSRGLRVFFSRESLPRLGSDEYHAQIDLAIEHARHMVVVTTSPEHVTSRWVEYEWRLFLGERLAGRKTGNLIAAIAGDMRIADLPISLRNRQVIRCEPDDLIALVDYVLGDVDRAGIELVEPAPLSDAGAVDVPGLIAISGLIVSTLALLRNASWSDATEHLQSRATEGQRGWRLPTLDELRLIRRESLLPSRSCYWSSQESGADEAFYMHFDDGHVGCGPKSYANGLSAVFVKTDRGAR